MDHPSQAVQGPYDKWLLPEPLGSDLTAPLRARLTRHDQFGPGQLAGRLFPMACVALEVTQRCNLDCTLCYLSDLAEAVPDTPLDTLMARIDRIHRQFGPTTNIQITGGDPTLRPIADLEALVRHIRALGMRSALFTNGIRAKRKMLQRLADAGLNDVCFHVDTTQERAGATDEASLHPIRLDYLERARGLGLRVNFNTTVHDDNLAEVPNLVRWFLAHANRVNLASFQMQADTGRGIAGGRGTGLTQASLQQMIEDATGGAADFRVLQIGHESCNRHASVLAAGGQATPFYADPGLFHALFDGMAGRARDWNRDRDAILAGLGVLARRPWLIARALRAAWRSVAPLAPRMLRGQRPHRLSFFIHNFMSADALEPERCESCIFQVMTDRGPLSMCAMNADRDRYLLGDLAPAAAKRLEGARAFKNLKGRLRANAAADRTAQ